MSKHPMAFNGRNYNTRIDYVGPMRPFGVHRTKPGKADYAFPKGVAPSKLPDGRNY